MRDINKAFNVSIIGQVKSGKSSFYNILFNNDIIPTSQKECSYDILNIIDVSDDLLYEME